MNSDNYSIKEFIEEKFTEVTGHLDRIENQTIKTNGRVTSLENDRARLWGAIGVLTFLGGAIIYLSISAIDNKIKQGVRDALAQYEVVQGVEIKSR